MDKKLTSTLVKWLRKSRVAVLKGGWSRERPISLKTGAAIEASLRRLKIPFKSIDVNHNIDEIIRKKKIGFAFLALHGTFGEDGGIQALLELQKIPYTGEDPLISALCMDKELSKMLFQRARVPAADGLVIRKEDFLKGAAIAIKKIQSKLKETPVFVKPADQGSAIGISRVTAFSQLGKALKSCFRISDRALIEKFIPGRELTVGILGDRVLPVVEIVPEHIFYDFHSKYAKGGSRHLVPAPLSAKLTREAQRIALKAFRSVGGAVYGRVDIMMSPSNKFYVLEVNTIPGMTNTSLLPDAARAAGINFDELVLSIVALSRQHRMDL